MLQYVLILVIFLYFLYRLTTSIPPPNFPPGPTNYPFAGGSWIIGKLDKSFVSALIKLGQKYGPVTGIYLGKSRSLVINGYDAVKEVLSRDEFSGRPEIFLNTIMFGKGKKLGLMFADGHKWKEQRRFTLRNLRDFGFGKSSMENVLHEEITDALTDFKKKVEENNGIVQLNDAFGPAVINVLWVILSGKRTSHDDPSFRRLLDLLYKLFRSGAVGDFGLQDFPWLRFIPPWSRTFKTMVDARVALEAMLKEEISSHEQSMDSSYSRDFMDLYLKEISTMERVGNLDSDFTKQQLIAICSDLFSAGAESTSNSIAFAMLYMILYPNVQEKVRKELDSVVGRSRLPSYMDDGPKLPYTTAVLCELGRIATIAPMTVPHYTVSDTTLNGYDIPKGTFILVLLASVHLDEDYWGKDAKEFKPERFMDEDGQLNKLAKSDHLMLFGQGKRACLGELLARMTTFDFFTAMLQNFTIELPPGSEMPSALPDEGFTVAPKPFSAMLKKR